MSEDIHICGTCRTEFRNLNSFLTHKSTCSVGTAGKTDPGGNNHEASISSSKPPPVSSTESYNQPAASDLKQDDFKQNRMSSGIGRGIRIVNSASVLGGASADSLGLIQSSSVLQPPVALNTGLVPVLLNNDSSLSFLAVNTTNKITGFSNTSSVDTKVSNPVPAKSIVTLNDNLVKPTSNYYLVLDQPIGKLQPMRHLQTSSQVLTTVKSAEPNKSQKISYHIISKPHTTNAEPFHLKNISMVTNTDGAMYTNYVTENGSNSMVQIAVDGTTNMSENVQTEAIQVTDVSSNITTSDNVQVLEGVSELHGNILEITPEGANSQTDQDEEIIGAIMDEDPVTISESASTANAHVRSTASTLSSMTTTIPTNTSKVMTILPKSFHCSRCNKQFQYKKDVDRHYRIHTGEKPFKCQYCDKRFTRTDKRRIHERVHTGDKPYKCTECDYQATVASSLKSHMLIHKDLKPFKCQICNYAARTSNALTVHLRVHTGDSPYVCYICQSSFKIKSDLNRHLRIHYGEKPFKCELCDYRCAIKGNMASHVKYNHSQEGKLSCQKCDFRTSSQKRLKNHMTISHTKRPVLVQAEFPGSDVTEAGSDQQQQLGTRRGTRLMKCTMCAFSCTNKMALTKHKKIHGVLEPYQCSLCSYTAHTRKQVKLHIEEKHASKKKTTAVIEPHSSKPLSICEKSFVCSKCDAAFVRADSLRCHMRNHMETEKVMAMTVLQLQNPFTLSSLTAAAEQQEDLDSSGILNLKNSQELYDDVDPITKQSSPRTSLPPESESLIDNDVTDDLDTDKVTDDLDTDKVTAEDMGSNPEDLDSERQTAVLSQAASNLLAFMENQQNLAMEDNMTNQARQRALNAAANNTTHSSIDSNTELNSINYSSIIAQPTSSLTHNTLTDPHENDDPGRVTTSFVSHWNPGSTGLLSLAEQALDNDGDMLLSNHSPPHIIDYTSAASPICSNSGSVLNLTSSHEQINAQISTPLSQMPSQNQAIVSLSQTPSYGQSNWEQLQQAVLQSVNLQSSERRNSLEAMEKEFEDSKETDQTENVDNDAENPLCGKHSDLEHFIATSH